MSAERLPGKPLLEVNGLPIICHVVKKAQETQIGEVVVATEDEEILNTVKKNHGEAILTSKNPQTGTDRIWEAFQKLNLKNIDYIINLQGDEPLIDINDIKKILGNPSTRSKFNNDIWIYIERKQTQSKIKNLGRMKIYKNDVLVLEIDDYGLLKKKDFYNVNDMKKIDIVKKTTEGNITKNSFIYDFMSSLRQKINDPLGVRAKKREEINQR